MPSVKLDNIAFVHIPRSAGTSIGRWLKTNIKTNSCKEWYTHPLLKDLHTTACSFTVVRNPWDRMVSLYEYSKNIKVEIDGQQVLGFSNTQAQAYLNHINNIVEWPNFNTWVENLETFKMPDIFWFNMLTKQTEWANGVDIVLRFEELEQEFTKIQQLVNCYAPLLKENYTAHTDYKYLYTTRTKDLIYTWFKDDINKWRYEF
jgi:hypothetical protein